MPQPVGESSGEGERVSRGMTFVLNFNSYLSLQVDCFELFVNQSYIGGRINLIWNFYHPF